MTPYPGLEPGTFRSEVERDSHFASRADANDIVPVDSGHLPSGTVPSTLEAGGGVREEALGGVSDGS
jgi:hypothetical protein